jgi:enoyl-CoA hydratase/carnithine racemase
VQGNAISAGLMLIWACDLIIAADDAKFSDVVGVRMGMPGVEYYPHPWEFGPRKAKELLLTGDSVDAEEAYRLAWCRRCSLAVSWRTKRWSSRAESLSDPPWRRF